MAFPVAKGGQPNIPLYSLSQTTSRIGSGLLSSVGPTSAQQHVIPLSPCRTPLEYGDTERDLPPLVSDSHCSGISRDTDG